MKHPIHPHSMQELRNLMDLHGVKSVCGAMADILDDHVEALPLSAQIASGRIASHLRQIEVI